MKINVVLVDHFLVPIPRFGILFRFTSLLLVMVPFYQYFRCCNEDGLILKPSRPATAIDSYFIAVSLTVYIKVYWWLIKLPYWFQMGF